MQQLEVFHIINLTVSVSFFLFETNSAVHVQSTSLAIVSAWPQEQKCICVNKMLADSINYGVASGFVYVVPNAVLTGVFPPFCFSFSLSLS